MKNLLPYVETPVTEFQSALLSEAGVRLFIKREDQNHPFVSGNKWWKLKYNLEAAKQQSHNTLLTFGGAYSNHIYATAAAAQATGFNSIGIIRGEETLPLNPTLAFAQKCGMHLHFISREAYRSKNDPDFIDSLKKKFGSCYLIPEGGTNLLAVKGCAELGKKLREEITFDYLCLPVGTGGTLAGLAQSCTHQKVIGFSSLKGGDFLADEVRQFTAAQNFQIETKYHFGGYGKTNAQLMRFIADMQQTHALPLDPIYTGKALFGVLDKIGQNFFTQGSTILFLHTGGLQGRVGFSFE